MVTAEDFLSRNLWSINLGSELPDTLMCSPFTVLYIHWGVQALTLFVIQPGEGKECSRGVRCASQSSELGKGLTFEHLILQGKVL